MQTHLVSTAIALGSMLLLLTPDAAAGQPLQLTMQFGGGGNGSTTGVRSDEAALHTLSLPNNTVEDSPNWILTGIFYRERGNAPCFIRAEFSQPTSTSNGARVNVSYNRCRGDSRNERGDRVRFIPAGASPNQGTGPVRGVASVAACVNNGRLKGIDLNSVLVRRAGVGTPQTLVDPEPVALPGRSVGGDPKESPNCGGNYQPPSTCPAGTVATRVDIFHEPASGLTQARRQVTGLRLICARMRLESEPAVVSRRADPQST